MTSLLQLLYRIARPLLFLLDAETAHRLVARLLGLAHRSRLLRWMLAGRAPRRDAAPSLAVRALGLDLASPVGLAAGFDKEARMYNALGALGFAFVEAGTVTAKAQSGNPRPRLFRLKQDRALVNRMGFNNPGARAVAEAILARPPDGVALGLNLGKSKVTPVEEAAADYAESARLLAPLADYLVINVSSPNTPGLRSLQQVEALAPIVDAVQAEIATSGRAVPLLVKIAPDLADEDIDAVADLAREKRLAGLVATNTTVARAGLRTPPAEVEALGPGGLSGAPLRARSLEVLRRLRARLGADFVLVAVGGIATAEDAWQSLLAGATLVQLYTALVYEGPAVARRIERGLRERMAAVGARTLAELSRDRGA